MLQAELWGHHVPEKAKQVRQAWQTIQVYNDHVFESYRRAFEQLDRDREANREAQKRDAPKDIVSCIPAGWKVTTFAEFPAEWTVVREGSPPLPPLIPLTSLSGAEIKPDSE